MILGVDPGLGGALALYDPLTDTLCVADMPTFTVTNSAGKARRKLDGHTLANIIGGWRPKKAVVEHVHSMPAQGIASALTFGLVTGRLLGILDALKVPYLEVEPAVWKRRFRVTADKDSSRMRASELMPQHAPLWQRKCDDGRAEAALLAYLGASL